MLIFWKVRGLNHLHKQRRLNAIFKLHKISIACILETHVLQDRQANVVDKIFPSYQFVDNSNHARLGRIWVLFDDAIRMQVHSSSDQALHCHVLSKTLGKYFFLSVVYASNNEAERRKQESEK